MINFPLISAECGLRVFDALVLIRAALRQILGIIAQNKNWGNEGEY
ncbi:hypothetical protein IQ264_28595 [Phormidium sp. LEGE 05292]|nr:hypothetical protein [Phormidium sp. LEGE 05292]MBE9229368.1 hypothetical protein [Phormidium sp. LEGE 05292]